MKSLLLTLIFVVATRKVISDDLGELKFVFTVFRHGDRSPIGIYSKDKHQPNEWPMGLGELSNLGKRNAYNLGQFFWNRYGKQFNISKVYDKTSKEFQIRSTSIHRAQMSAVYFLAGFYQEDFDNVLTKENKFTEFYDVPFKSQDYDQLLSMTPCPKYDRLLSEWKEGSPEYKAFIKYNQDLFNMLHTYAGTNNENDVGQLADDVYCELAHNMSQPDWVIKNLGEIMKFFNDSRKFISPTKELQKIATGPLLNRFVEVVKNKIHGDEAVKMDIFSAHDTNVINILTALECFNDIQPPYSSAVILELRQVKKLYYIHVLYHNDTKVDVYQLQTPGCTDQKYCLFSGFRKHVDPVLSTLTERDFTCGHVLHSTSFKLSDNIIPITAAVVVIVLAAMIFIMYRIYRKRRRVRTDPMLYKPLAYGEDDDDDV